MKREPMWRRYARFFGRNRRADTTDEVRFHYEMRVKDYMRRGMNETDARRAADERLGGVDRTLAGMAHDDERMSKHDHRREWLDELSQDIRYGVRTLVRAPAFAVVTILTLAIAIGSTTAVFSVVNGVLLAALPYPHPEQLVRIYERRPEGRNDRNPVSPGNYVDWSKSAHSFLAIGAYSSPGSTALTGDGEPTQIVTRTVTPSYFTVYAARPILGRTFLPEDANAGGVTVLAERFWRSRFGGDTSVVGRTLTLSGRAVVIRGVLPQTADDDVDAWTIVTTSNLSPTERKSHNYNVIARLAPGVSREQAQQEMTGIARTLGAAYPEFMKGWDVNVIPLHEDIVGESRRMLLVLTGAVAVVLLIACANIANLLLSRASARQREIVLRGALGAGRGRLVRQLLTESLVIAVAGGVLGVAGAAVSLRALLSAAPPIPLAGAVHVNLVVIAFAIAITVFCTLLFGLVPALHLAKMDLQRNLRTSSVSSGSAHHSQLRGALLTLQIALSVVLLVSAGLLVRSFQTVASVDTGLRVEGLSTFALNLPRSRYQTIPAQVQFYDDLLTRIASVPGVRGVAGTSLAPGDGASTWSFSIEGRPTNNPSGREDPEPVHFVAGDYFGVMGVPIGQGRAFTAFDRADAPAVVLINESLAKLHWQNENPVGKRISFTGPEGPWAEIVGVVGDTRMASQDVAAEPAMYLPYAQKAYPWLSWLNVMVRTDPGVDPVSLVPSLRAAVWAGDRSLPVTSLTAVEDLYQRTIATRKFAMMLVGAFGVVALALCVIGLYGLIAYNVSQQVREIGVRLALGATEGGIAASVIGTSAKLALAGAALGLAGAFASTRLIAGLLYGVSPVDPATFGATVAAVFAIAIIAAWIPARRASRTSPLTALRG